MTTVAALLVAAAPAQAKPVPIRAWGVSTDLHGVELDCPPPPTGTTGAELAGGTTFGENPADPPDSPRRATLRGTDTWTACFLLRPDGSAISAGTGHFTGTLDRCGTGTLTYRFVSWISAPDPVSSTRTSRSTNWIVSGGDGLTGVTGTFTGSSTITPGLTEAGEIQGTATCRARDG